MELSGAKKTKQESHTMPSGTYTHAEKVKWYVVILDVPLSAPVAVCHRVNDTGDVETEPFYCWIHCKAFWIWFKCLTECNIV